MMCAMVDRMETNTKDREIQVGDRVLGRYYGVPFCGEVKIARGHTINWATRVIHVDLTNNPITVFDRERDGICVEVQLIDGGWRAIDATDRTEIQWVLS